MKQKPDGPDAMVSDEVVFHSAIVRLSGSLKLGGIMRRYCLQAFAYDERTSRLVANNGTPVIKYGRKSNAHRG